MNEKRVFMESEVFGMLAYLTGIRIWNKGATLQRGFIWWFLNSNHEDTQELFEKLLDRGYLAIEKRLTNHFPQSEYEAIFITEKAMNEVYERGL